MFLPVFIASGVSTLPEYMRKRFGGDRIRVYLACLSLVLYVFTKISVNLYAGKMERKLQLGWLDGVGTHVSVEVTMWGVNLLLS